MIRCSLKQPFCLALGVKKTSNQLNFISSKYEHHSSEQSIFIIYSDLEEMRLEEALKNRQHIKTQPFSHCMTLLSQNYSCFRRLKEEHLGDFCINVDQIWSAHTLRLQWLLKIVALLKSFFLFNLHNIQWHFLNMKSICLQLDTQLYLTLIYITALIKNTPAFLLRTLISWMLCEVYK